MANIHPRPGGGRGAISADVTWRGKRKVGREKRKNDEEKEKN
jgi:hypothetical protein